MKTEKKGRGRPRKSSDEKKGESLLLRLDAREKQGFLEAAQIAGVPLTVWIRERLRKLAAKELEQANKPVPFLS